MTRIFDLLVAPMTQTVGDAQTINGQSVNVESMDAEGNITRANGLATINDGAAGYAKGCFFFLTNAPAGTIGLYENIGDTSACEFVPCEGVTPAQLDLAQNKIFLGGVGNVAVQKMLGVATTNAITTAQIASKAAYERLYIGAVGGAGTGLVIGSTLLQATSTATGTVVHVGSGYIDINTITGAFDASHVVTATNDDLSTNTFTPSTLALDVWVLPVAAASIPAVASQAGALALVQSGIVPTTGKTRYVAALHEFETLLSDSFTALNVDYAPAAGTVVVSYS
jgi:hypothetical protein